MRQSQSYSNVTPHATCKNNIEKRHSYSGAIRIDVQYKLGGHGLKDGSLIDNIAVCSLNYKFSLTYIIFTDYFIEVY